MYKPTNSNEEPLYYYDVNSLYRYINDISRERLYTGKSHQQEIYGGSRAIRILLLHHKGK